MSVYEAPLNQRSVKDYEVVEQLLTHKEKIFSTPFHPLQVAPFVTVANVRVEESFRRWSLPWTVRGCREVPCVAAVKAPPVKSTARHDRDCRLGVLTITSSVQL